MPSILGHIIVIAVLAVIVYFCSRSIIRDILHELHGGGCAGCSGGCSHANCASCGGCGKGSVKTDELSGGKQDYV